jgi:hypothetical protein
VLPLLPLLPLLLLRLLLLLPRQYAAWRQSRNPTRLQLHEQQLLQFSASAEECTTC